MDGGARRAAVHGVAKSRTRLGDAPSLPPGRGRLRVGAHLGEGHIGELVHLQSGLLSGAVVELTLEDAGRCHRGNAHACGGGRGAGVRPGTSSQQQRIK